MRYLFAVIVCAVFALAGCANSCGDSTTKNYQPTASVLLVAEPFYCTQLEKTFKDIDAEALVTSIVGGQFVFTPDADTPELPDYLPATITFGPLASCEVTIGDDGGTDMWGAKTDCATDTFFTFHFQSVESAVTKIRMVGGYAEGNHVSPIIATPADVTCDFYSLLEDNFPQDGGHARIICDYQSNRSIYPFVWHAPQ